MRTRTEDFTRLVSAMFDSRDHAEKARQDLIAAGITDDAIVIAGADPARPLGDAGDADHREGFWETLKELFMPDEDRYSFAEGMRRGGVTISVKTDTATHDRVVDVLDRDGAVDLDEREQSWRSEGWSGYTARDPIVDGRSEEPGSVVLPEEEPSYAPPSNATAGFTASAADHFRIDAAPPVESPGALPEAERLATPDSAYAASAPGPDPAATARIGIRDTSHGRSRIRTYLTDSPPDTGSDDRP
jgi:hypothetical protein